MQRHWTKSHSQAKPLRIGFIALCDAAPLIMARELGLYEKFGLRVQLSREVGWATVRDKIIYRELDAAHALAPMVFSASLGLGSMQADCVTGLVLGLDGNTITLAQALWEEGVRDGASLRHYVRKHQQPLIFAIPFKFSSHHFLLRRWLAAHELQPGRDVQFVVVPPPQMAPNLKAGHLHGFCVAEPWSTVAIAAGFGWRAATSAEIAPHHPEKVVMVRREFAESRAEEHERLIAALVEACRFCAQPQNQERIAETLGEEHYLNAPAAALKQGCHLTFSPPGTAELEALEPSADKAAWIINNLRECGCLPESVTAKSLQPRNIFSPEIFQNAIKTQLQYARETSIRLEN